MRGTERRYSGPGRRASDNRRGPPAWARILLLCITLAIAVYVMVFLALLLALLATGLDVVTAFSAVGAAINNLGPGLEGVSQNYSLLADAAKWILCIAMLLGRLEIFTLLVLFLPMFWRR